MRLAAAAAAALLVLISGCAPTTIEHLGPASPYPFSDGTRIGNLIFLSGQIGNAPGDPSKVVPGGIAEETRQALTNIKTLLDKNGSSMDRILKCTVMLADMNDWPAMNTVYATFFPGPKPARSAFGASGLALGAAVEIECIAVASK